MFDNAILEKRGTLKCVPDCYKNKKMCKKAGDSFAHALDLVSSSYKTQEMCNKAANVSPSAIKFLHACSTTQ